jgi:hypothetical protein
MNRAERVAMIALCIDLSMQRQSALIGLARSGVYRAGPRRVGAGANAVDRRAV